MDNEKKIEISALIIFCIGLGLLFFVLYHVYMLIQNPPFLYLKTFVYPYPESYFENMLSDSISIVALIIMGVVACKITIIGIKFYYRRESLIKGEEKIDFKKEIEIPDFIIFGFGLGFLIFIFYLAHFLFKEPSRFYFGEIGIDFGMFIINILIALVCFVVFAKMGAVVGKITSKGMEVFKGKGILYNFNIFATVGGLMMLISVLESWIRYFNMNLIDLLNLSFEFGEDSLEIIIIPIIILLMVIGGIQAINKGIIGGVIGIIGIIVFLLMIGISEFGDVFNILGVGFYLALLGAIFALISKKVKFGKKIQHDKIIIMIT